MKKIFKAASLALAALTLTAAACGGGLENATELGAPAEVTPLGYYEAAKTDPALRDAAKAFAAKFTAEAVKGRGTDENTAVSPISVYLALGLAAECASGETREELLSALGTDYGTLKENYSDLYRSVIAEYKTEKGEVSARADVGNSIWIDSHATAKQACIDDLSNSYLCYSYSAEFFDDNKGANEAVRDFVKQQTHGIIDQNFELSDETLFTLINTLYLKEVWNKFGDDLSLTHTSYPFMRGDGSQKDTKLLEGYYTAGRAYEAETFTHFYTQTQHGYQLKFLLPKEGHTAEEVFTAENIALVNGMTDYRKFDYAPDGTTVRTEYLTRCLFPEYVAEYNEDVKPILQDLGVKKFFTFDCEFETLTDDDVYCEKVQHVAKLEVNRKGIEGAAVTVIAMNGESAPGGPEIEIVRADFILDRAFGFLLTDRLGNVLFSGIVNQI